MIEGLLDAIAESQPIIREPAPRVEGRRLHVDGDMMAYLAGGGKDATVETSRNMFWGKLGSLMNGAGTEDVILHLTVSGSLKGNRPLYSVTQPYQHQRVGKVRPKNWAYMRDYMAQGHRAFRIMQWSDREADDGLLLAAQVNRTNVIASGDKDMRQGYGLHCTWDTNELIEVPQGCYEMVHNDLLYGDKWLLTQLLTGDDADHIPGMGRGYGPAYAAKVLAGTTCRAEGMEAVLKEYTNKFGTEPGIDRLAEQFFLLYIRRTTKAPDTEWLDWCPYGAAHPLHIAGINHYKRVLAALQEAREINAAIKNNAGQTYAG